MIKFFSCRATPKGSLPSPAYFLQWAALLFALFLITNLADMREFTSVLNGTVGSTSLDWQTASFLGAAYVMTYLAFILGAPTLIIAAGILVLWRKIAGKRLRNDESKSSA